MRCIGNKKKGAGGFGLGHAGVNWLERLRREKKKKVAHLEVRSGVHNFKLL